MRCDELPRASHAPASSSAGPGGAVAEPTRNYTLPNEMSAYLLFLEFVAAESPRADVALCRC